ncbi:hypothetical protein TNCV_1718491 [Trichonephila clavipes]|nr:hypothetical protein TNCV_1718491 [Trichonephila clavipes]
MNKIRKTPAWTQLSDRPTESSEEFVAVDDDNVCTAPTMTIKGILELIQNSKNFIDADSDDENERNNTVPTSKGVGWGERVHGPGGIRKGAAASIAIFKFKKYF